MVYIVEVEGVEPSSKHPFTGASTMPALSLWRESNPRHADYGTAALPTELHRQNFPVFSALDSVFTPDGKSTGLLLIFNVE